MHLFADGGQTVVWCRAAGVFVAQPQLLKAGLHFPLHLLPFLLAEDVIELVDRVQVG